LVIIGTFSTAVIYDEWVETFTRET